jgi:hypothetical protein
MANETLKALLMIALFGLFETMMNFQSIQRLRASLHGAVNRLWHTLVAPAHALQPIHAKGAKGKRRKG